MKAIITALALSLSACAVPLCGDEAPKPAPVIATPIQLDDDLFMVPLSNVDKDGCQGWRLQSETRMVVQAIHYQRADGTFTNNKREAACYDRQN